jgi:hypothetical protein
MPDAAIVKFKGLDVRRVREASDPRSARVATNVDLTLGQEFKARDGLRHLMQLDPQSKGLYALGGTLRAVIPGGQNKALEAIGPVRVKYDHLGFGEGYFKSIMVACDYTDKVRLEGAEWPNGMVGRTLAVGGNTYNIVAQSGVEVTLDAPVTALPGLYPFVLSGTPSLASRTVTMVNGTDKVTISGDTWPTSIDGSSFSITRNGFTAHVAARVSSTELRLDKTLETGTVTDVEFQVSGFASAYPLDTLLRVTGVESIGANASFGVYPYLVVERYLDAAVPERGTVFEHHWITRDAVNSATALATQVNLPFSPGPSVIKMAGKLWAADDVNGVVRFSSTANGPRDWTTAQDAGYIPVITHASGDRRIQGLGLYDDKLAVIFADSVQLWATDPQPSNITLVRVINGPGTEQPRSVVNVLGDLFYATRGGFRSLQTQTVTGQIQENDDIGGPIDDLVKAEEGEAAVARWSQIRGQYLCAFGSRVYAFKYSPKSKVQGWTTWELGVPVDAMTELDGVTYIRSGNDLYQLEAGYDDGSTWEVVFNDFGGKDVTKNKRFDFMEVIQRGTCDVRFFVEPDNETYYLEGPRLVGSTVAIDRVFVGAMSRVLGIRFTGQGPWTLSSIQLQFVQLPW